MTQSASVTINGQQIPWSYIQHIRQRIFRGDWDSTIDAFWKARKASGNPRAIIRYINAGLKPNEKNQRYIMYPSEERNAGKMAQVRSWWENDVYKRQYKESGMASMKDIFRQLAG